MFATVLDLLAAAENDPIEALNRNYGQGAKTDNPWGTLSGLPPMVPGVGSPLSGPYHAAKASRLGKTAAQYKAGRQQGKLSAFKAAYGSKP